MGHHFLPRSGFQGLRELGCWSDYGGEKCSDIPGAAGMIIDWSAINVIETMLRPYGYLCSQIVRVDEHVLSGVQA